MIVYKLSKLTGFFSEFFFVCQAYLYSRHIHQKFAIVDTNWLYTEWHRYFTSLEVVHDHPNPFVYNQHTPVKLFSVREYRDAVRTLFTLRAPLRIRVEHFCSSLPSDFIGLFVRRGDKLICEAPYISVRDILSKIPYTDSSVFFLQTDDSSVIQEAKEILGDRVLSTVPATKRGSYHSDWLKKTPSDIRNEIEEMLVGLAVCLRSTQCWTDHTSNVGRFLALYNPTSVYFYTTDQVVDEECLIHPSFSIFE